MPPPNVAIDASHYRGPGDRFTLVAQGDGDMRPETKIPRPSGNERGLEKRHGEADDDAAAYSLAIRGACVTAVMPFLGKSSAASRDRAVARPLLATTDR